MTKKLSNERIAAAYRILALVTIIVAILSLISGSEISRRAVDAISIAGLGAALLALGLQYGSQLNASIADPSVSVNLEISEHPGVNIEVAED